MRPPVGFSSTGSVGVCLRACSSARRSDGRIGFSLSVMPGHPGVCDPSTTFTYNSTIHQMFSELGPADARPWPSRERGCVDSQVDQVNGLLATVQQQLGLAGMGGARRVILHQDVCRAVQVGMFDVEGHLVGRQVDLAASFDHLELDHHKHPVRECHQDIRDAQVDPGFNPGEMAVWDIFPDPLVQVRFRFQGHWCLPLQVLLRSAWGSRPQWARPGHRTGV